MADKYLGDNIPKFDNHGNESGDVSLTNWSALTKVQKRTVGEVILIILFAVCIVGGLEAYVIIYEVPQFVFPRPSAIATALFTDFEFIVPHLGHTLVELFSGFFIGASIGLILAGVITQFPFVEKIVAPYILMLVTTPMLALVPLLILRFGFGYEPRIIAVALASGPMVMINSATGFRRVDLAKIALARSFGASTMQIFLKVRVPMALPMIIVGLMVGAIFGLLTAGTCNSSRSRDGWWWFWPWESTDNVFSNDQDAPVLCDHSDSLDLRDSDLFVLLFRWQEVG